MGKVILNLEGTVVYIDDLCVYFDNWEDHMIRLERLFEWLRKYHLSVSLKKSNFGKAIIKYLGHEVGQRKVSPSDAKVLAIKEYPVPRDKKGNMRFLGLAGFFRKFCRNFSVLASSMTDLLKKGTKFVWEAKQQQAFESIKAILTHEPVLRAPDFGKAYSLSVDACDVGISAVLLQTDEEGIQHPISYYSKKLSRAQRNYSTVEKEALALILALQHYEVYIGASEEMTRVYTDHNPLVFIQKMKDKNQRLLRWSLLLQGFNICVKHIKGRDNVVADALSRAHWCDQAS